MIFCTVIQSWEPARVRDGMRAQSEPARVRDGLRTQEPDRLRELMNGSCGPEHKDLRVGRGAKRQTSFYKITISVRMARGEGQLHGAISLVTKPVSTYMSFHSEKTSEFSLIIHLPRPKYCMSLAMFRPYFPILPARIPCLPADEAAASALTPPECGGNNSPESPSNKPSGQRWSASSC